jgi:hypothetical protein
MHRLLALVALILWAQGPAAALFEIDLWPGEGIPVFEATGPELHLREQPWRSSNVTVVVKVRPKQRLAFDDTRYRTVGSGWLLALASAKVTGRNMGDITCFVRIRGLLVDADPCPAADAEFRLETRPATEWWIHVVLGEDSKGWLLVGEATAKLVDRKD